jgi:uncharacterized protein YbcC (UPF0753/DUF2309 family)
MSATRPSRDESDRMDDLEAIVRDAAEFLPQQPPLHAFVHHNTLHHFEHLPFEQAVVAASEILGTEGFQSEAAFEKHIASGRIQDHDVLAVLAQEIEAGGRALFDGGPTQAEY